MRKAYRRVTDAVKRIYLSGYDDVLFIDVDGAFSFGLVADGCVRFVTCLLLDDEEPLGAVRNAVRAHEQEEAAVRTFEANQDITNMRVAFDVAMVKTLGAGRAFVKVCKDCQLGRWED